MKRILLLLFLTLAASLALAQKFDIEAFSDSTKYGWENYLDRADYREELSRKQALLQLYELEINSLKRGVLKSMVAPGWGQFDNKQSIKGSIFLASEIAMVGASLYFFDRSNYYYQRYLNATQVEEIESNYNAAVAPRQYSLIFAGVGALIWAYNIFDVIQSTEEYNARVWQRIEAKDRESRVRMDGIGIEIEF
ncbi:MAG TPA: DUF5683 domain-containing protein [Candidatus Cloacimonadota bacterium]|nr:DUF5683 domain-containing protein [Candidatus Cloacimonadota bacterium]